MIEDPKYIKDLKSIIAKVDNLVIEQGYIHNLSKDYILESLIIELMVDLKSNYDYDIKYLLEEVLRVCEKN